MRTKTILLTAAAAVAGIASSNAQVFSVNAVGYVNKTIPAKKFALISNPLNAASNKISDLFKGIPFGTQLYKFKTDGTGWDQGLMDDADNAILPTTFANLTVNPGEGIFVKNNGTTDFTVTFVGEVMQGTLKNPIPAGLSVRSSQVPQAGTLSALGIPGKIGDTVYVWDVSKQLYNSSPFDDADLTFVPNASIGVGDAIFISAKAAGSWDRTFSVN